jgi:hypothetical protein
MAVMGERAEHAVVDLEGAIKQKPTRAVFYAGFRRSNQDAPGSGETWNAAMSTSDLANLPNDAVVPELPEDITLACVNMVIANMRWQFKGLVGVNERQVSADRLQFTSRKAVDGYIDQQLESIRRHRKAPF